MTSRVHGFWRRAAALAPLALLCLATSSLRADVQWQSGARKDPRPMDAEHLRQAVTQLAARTDARRVVVHLDAPVDEARRQALAASGVRLLGYLGDHAWFATLSEAIDPAGAAAVPGLVAVEPVAAEHKLHPDLLRGEIHPWAVIPTTSKAAPPGEIEPSGDSMVAVYVLFHPDFDTEREAAGVLARHGGTIASWMRAIDGVVAHLPAAAVPALAAEDAVMWVEPPLPAFRELNDSNRDRVGANEAQQPPYGLDGSGVTVLVYDGGKAFAHPDFSSRLQIGASDTSGISDHATHVTGTIGGSGAGSGGQFRGMAPAVSIVSYGFEMEGGLQQGFLYTDPGDIEADYTEAVTTYGADISNNSIGTNTAHNGFPCEWEGNYGATSALIDAIARGSIGSPFRIVWANGNERTGSCGSSYHTTAPPACGKNHITIGAMNSNDDSVTSFTSWGPCDDGRLKPDVSAPGCQSGGDNGVTSTSSSGSYNVKCGTSMASPTACGVGALLVQQYRQTFPDAPDLRNATLKAILAHTAEDIQSPGPDYKTGYGSIRAIAAADLIREERVIEAEVEQDEAYSFIVIVDSGEPQLKVTVAWDDAPGSPNVDPVLVNDLDLRVLDSGGTVYYPWTLDPDNPSANAVRTQRDGVNNIEQVVIDNPAPGAYRVEVVGFNIAQGPAQTFGAAASPSLINCSPAGILVTDRARISCDADLGVRVIDCDLNTDDGTAESVAVSLVSGAEPGGETLTLVETAPEAAAFLGSIHVSTTDASGVLHVAPGDTITASYVDADDGNGNTNVTLTRQVTLDCTAPHVTSIAVVAANPRDATLSIGIDEPARATVRWGTTCAALGGTQVSFSLATSHVVTLSGLEDDTTYFFAVDVQDEAGNASTDDNGGACHSFTTPEIPDFFTEQFTSGFDLVGLTLTFTPNGSADFYAACAEPVGSSLPTDPTGGTDLDLGDDQPGSFDLQNGAQVLHYGQSYSRVWVGPNGYVTFGSGDSTYLESLSTHFSKPRVAARFDDLDPRTQGEISWKQLADRVAVSWLDVPQYNTSDHNTFQIELFFDGRIRMSWLQLSGNDGVTGLSRGVGLDPDFLPSDLSAAGACGENAPTAYDASLTTGIGQPVTTQLQADDDGLPAPPALVYRITSLPWLGTLVDQASGLAVDHAPYTLAGSGVTYTPIAGHIGQDEFSFVADDGGTPPDGGSSAPARVDVTVGSVPVLYEFLVNDAAPLWAYTGSWAFGTPTGGGSGNHDPTGGASGQNVVGYNLSGDYANNLSEEWAKTRGLDLSGASGTRLEFWRWLGIGDASGDHARVDVSTGGGPWTAIWSHSGGPISENAWTLQSYDISAVADGHSSVVVRWVMGTTDGSGTAPGWNLDDVRIRGSVPGPCTGAPGEPYLRFDSDKQSLRWLPSPFAGGTLPVYDVIRSEDPAGFPGAVCLASGSPAVEADDPAVPPSGVVRYYLARGENSCGSGSWGSGAGAPPPGVGCP